MNILPINDQLEEAESGPCEQEPAKKARLAAALRFAGNAVFGVLLLLMALLALFLVQGKISGGVPTLFGHRIYVVLSGSMKPAFDTGSLIFVRPGDAAAICPGDVITFGSPRGGDAITTHRVVGLEHDGGLKFVTRGDANNVNDPAAVPAENVIGRVRGSVPLLGYLLFFARTRLGLILLIIVPGLLVIAGEVHSIYRHLGGGTAKGTAVADRPGCKDAPALKINSLGKKEGQ